MTRCGVDAGRSEQPLGERVTEALCDGLALKGAALYRVTVPGEPMRLACANGVIDAPPQLSWAEAARPAWDSVETLPLVLGEAAPDDWGACMPIRADGHEVGLLALGHKRSGDGFGSGDGVLLELVAAQLAAAWHGGPVGSAEGSRVEPLGTSRPTLLPVVAHAPRFSDIIGTSPGLLRALDLVERVGASDASVLITGETGTGKELIARALHERSARRTGPMIAVNCPAIPLDLAESELFGHERGAYTGATEARPGKIELADHGTVFLDEVAELPLVVQVKLLRVLQEREVQRVGSNRARRIDVRVVAATNRDLRGETSSGSFREDLFYRLAAVPIHLPPLRERCGDVPILASHFLAEACVKHAARVRGFAPETLAVLEAYAWPGNVRELQHVVQRAVLLCDGDCIEPAHLGELDVDDARKASLHSMLQREKVRRIEAALSKTRGNQSAAARLLGMSRSNFARLLKTLQVHGAKKRSDWP